MIARGRVRKRKKKSGRRHRDPGQGDGPQPGADGRNHRKHTGQPIERVSEDIDRDYILTAEQAVQYGAVDEIITSRKIRPELAVAAGGS